jgi:hypothetical protein
MEIRWPSDHIRFVWGFFGVIGCAMPYCEKLRDVRKVLLIVCQ